MKEDDQAEKPSGSSYFRYRSPVFSREEVNALLELVRKYKSIVFNKSNNAATVAAKESAWMKIEKLFNRQGFTHTRSAECLKTKFENLKKRARTTSKNVLDDTNDSADEVTNQLVALMCDAENNPNVCGDETLDSDADGNDDEQLNETSDNDNENKRFERPVARSDRSRLVNRTMNFSPEECSALLQCVRQEKKIILSNSISAAAINSKSKAWSRITRRYNNISPQKRSTKVLRTKFENMKRLAKNMSLKDYLKDFGKKHERLQETKDTARKIKSEPFDQDEYKNNSGDEDDNNIDEANDSNNLDNSNFDPLGAVLNSDFGSLSQSESKEIVRLKTMLINYELQTAKLQRKRLEDLMAAETQERDARAIETSLRLRAARLETIAAEMKLPLSHPALAYTAEEARAQHYITQQYHPN